MKLIGNYAWDHEANRWARRVTLADYTLWAWSACPATSSGVAMIKPADAKKFHELAQQLTGLLVKIRKYNPEAEIFVEGESGLMLFDGPARGDDDADRINWSKQVGESHWTPGLGCGAA